MNRQSRIVSCRFILAQRRRVQQIARNANEMHADFAVLGITGRGVLRRTLGSTTGYLLGRVGRPLLVVLVVFTGLTAAGLVWRSRPSVHRRLMLLGTIGGLMWPAITRMPVVAGRFPIMFGLLTTLVLAPAIRDFVTGSKARWLTLSLGVAIMVTFPLRVMVGNSAGWRTVAAWLIR